MWRIALITGGLAVAGIVPAAAQEPTDENPTPRKPTRLQGGFGVVGGVPVGAFAIHVPEGAGGGLAHLDVGLGTSLFSVGGELAWLEYGSESREVSLGPIIPEVPDLAVKVNTTNALWLFHGRVRMQRPYGRWRPYVDGLLGFAHLYTKTVVEGLEDVCDSDSCTTPTLGDATHASDSVLSYGGGAGLMVGLTGKPSAPRLDVSLRFLRGGEAEYLTQGSIHRDGSHLTFDVSRSQTDMTTLYIGITFGR